MAGLGRGSAASEAESALVEGMAKEARKQQVKAIPQLKRKSMHQQRQNPKNGHTDIRKKRGDAQGSEL